MNKKRNTERGIFQNASIVIAIYILFWIILNMIGALLFSLMLESVTYGDCFWMIVFSDIDYENAPFITLIVYSIIHLLDMIAGVILTSYIFLFFINRKPKVILPNKLVIRKRTSEGSLGMLYISVMVGNRSYYLFDDVTCTIHCTYMKTDMGGGINSEYESSNSVIAIENYYRFSFELEKLPHQFLRNFIRKDTIAIDAIIVKVSGQTSFGGAFKLSRKYRISDIIISDKEPVYKIEKNSFLFGSKQKVIWDNIINHPNDCNEVTRTEIINEIKEMCEYPLFANPSMHKIPANIAHSPSTSDSNPTETTPPP